MDDRQAVKELTALARGLASLGSLGSAIKAARDGDTVGAGNRRSGRRVVAQPGTTYKRALAEAKRMAKRLGAWWYVVREDGYHACDEDELHTYFAGLDPVATVAPDGIVTERRASRMTARRGSGDGARIIGGNAPVRSGRVGEQS